MNIITWRSVVLWCGRLCKCRTLTAPSSGDSGQEDTTEAACADAEISTFSSQEHQGLASQLFNLDTLLWEETLRLLSRIYRMSQEKCLNSSRLLAPIYLGTL